MSCGNIIQISDHPIPLNERMSASCYTPDDWFTREVSSMITDTEDYQADLTWLYNIFAGLVEQPYLIFHGVFVFKPDFKQIWFADKHRAFIEEAQRLAKVSLDDFIRCVDLCDLRDAYSTQYEAYVCYTEESSEVTFTLDEFIRSALPGRAYYIGGACDYTF